MKKKRSLYLAVFLAAAFSISTPAQFTNAKFVSFEGGFTIDLPTNVDQGVRPVGSMSTGAATYSWKLNTGDFTVGFFDGIRTFHNGFPILNEFADTVSGALVKGGRPVTDRIEFNHDGNPGIQLKAKRDGGISLNRFIMVGSRLYTLTADCNNESENVCIQILDSFTVIDSKVLLA